MKNKRYFNSLIAVAVVSSMVVMPVSATGLEQQKASAQHEVSTLQAELTDLMTQIGSLEIQLTEKGEEINQAESDLSAAQLKKEEQYEAMKLRIKYMYEDGNIAMVEKIITSGTFAEMLEQASYAGAIHEYDRNALTEYQANETKIADLKVTLESDMASLQEMEADYHSHQSVLDATISSKQSEVANIDQQIQAAAEAAAKAVEAQQAEANGGNITITTTTAVNPTAPASEPQSNTTNANQSNPNTVTDTGSSTNSNAPADPPASPIVDVPDDSNTSTNTDTSAGADYSAQRQAIVAAAYSQLGVPYRWAGSTPGVGLDCSGLTQYCYRQAGVYLDHYSESQMASGRITYNPKPGDICWKPGHVAIYIGNGKMIEAQQTGTNIMISNVRVRNYITYFD